MQFRHFAIAIGALISASTLATELAESKSLHHRSKSGWIITDDVDPKSDFHIKATTAYQVKKAARSTRTHMKKTTKWVSGEPIKAHSTKSTKSFHKHNYSAYLGTAKPKLNEGKPCYTHKTKSSELGIEPHPGPKKCRTKHLSPHSATDKKSR